MPVFTAFIFTAVLILAFRRLDRWDRWESRNRSAAGMLFAGLTDRERLIKRLISEPPDRHSDLWR